MNTTLYYCTELEIVTTHWRSLRHGRLLLLLTGCAWGAAVAAAADPAAMASTDPRAIDWQTSPLDLDLRGMNGERYSFRCPPGKPEPAHVDGSGPYTDSSSICTAAVHAGYLRPKAGGEVTIEIRPGQDSYPGSERNYVKSATCDRPWSGSFIVLRPAAGAADRRSD